MSGARVAIAAGDCASWRPPREPVILDGSQVHVWMLELAPLSNGLVRLEALLGEEELARADCFRFSRDRARFVGCRAALRMVLGRYLGRPPGSIRLGRSSIGKPFLDEPGGSALQFNLSHSEDLALIAVASGRCVGVDIERIQIDRVSDEIAERFFSRQEASALRALPLERRRVAFFSCWTRKEAYLKGRGVGLSVPLASFSVSLAPGELATLLRSESGEEELSCWCVRDLPVPPGYAAAVAAEGREWLLCLWRCLPELFRQYGVSYE